MKKITVFAFDFEKPKTEKKRFSDPNRTRHVPSGEW
jgi:hypothetical protein